MGKHSCINLMEFTAEDYIFYCLFGTNHRNRSNENVIKHISQSCDFEFFEATIKRERMEVRKIKLLHKAI